MSAKCSKGQGGNRTHEARHLRASRRRNGPAPTNKHRVAMLPTGFDSAQPTSSDAPPRNTRRSAAVRVSEVSATMSPSLVKKPIVGLNVSRNISLNAHTIPDTAPAFGKSRWEKVTRLAESFRRYGFKGGHLLALRVVSEGVESALSTVLLAFYNAISEHQGDR